MIAWHYYMAERLNPVAMFGLIYVFEGLGQGEGGEAARALARNLPPKALTFLAKHAHLDVKHLEEARATMRKHVHSEEDERSIIYAARAALELYTFMFEQIWARYEASARGGAPAEVGAAEGVLVA
jgi:pyrroloquinoline quinone (PQQ) biosynthesis protein C